MCEYTWYSFTDARMYENEESNSFDGIIFSDVLNVSLWIIYVWYVSFYTKCV